MIRKKKKVEMVCSWHCIFRKKQVSVLKEMEKTIEDTIKRKGTYLAIYLIHDSCTRATCGGREIWLVDWVLKRAPIDQLPSNRPSQFSVWNLQFFAVYVVPCRECDVFVFTNFLPFFVVLCNHRNTVCEFFHS